MRRIALLIISLFLIFNFSYSNAVTIKIISKEESDKINKEISREEIFNYLSDSVTDNVPESYKYIALNIKWINSDTKLYSSLQKLVYLDLIKNVEVKFLKTRKLNAYTFFKLSENIYNVDLISELDESELKERNVIFGDFASLEKLLSKSEYDFDFTNDFNLKVTFKKKIFTDVYKTLQTSHYDKDKIDNIDLLDWAIEGLASGTKDKYTVYFPPAKNKNFNESLTWEYEGIGAYVDMETPGQVSIVSPIIWSPAEKAWLKWWDIITSVDGVQIEKENSLSEVVSWIKWPAWTKVVLVIKRGTKTLEVEVIRWNIIIKDVEYKVIDRTTFYIELKFFGPTIFKDFKAALEELKETKGIKKVIIDLRSNPGWYLDQVTNILGFFVAQWEPTAVVKYQDSEMSYKSKWYDLIDFSNYKLVILQNSWSASASEIMIWTIKDYYPEAVLIWEKTYWKGSVQTIKAYSDGSSLKYTIAKWFTWLTQTGIDWVWIKPDIEIIVEEYITDESKDIQLKKAREIR